jgi:hypothetical protein
MYTATEAALRQYQLLTSNICKVNIRPQRLLGCSELEGSAALGLAGIPPYRKQARRTQDRWNGSSCIAA